jgi:hypothetical protein
MGVPLSAGIQPDHERVALTGLPNSGRPFLPRNSSFGDEIFFLREMTAVSFLREKPVVHQRPRVQALDPCRPNSRPRFCLS